MAKQVKEVVVIARYAHKTEVQPGQWVANGNVSYLVRNGGGKEYCVTLTANGNTACVHHDPEKKQDIPESCEASQHGRKCYHIKAVVKLEEARGWQKNAKPLSREQALADARAASEEALSQIDEEAKLAKWTSSELASLGNNRHQLPAPVNAPKPLPVSREWMLGRR